MESFGTTSSSSSCMNLMSRRWQGLPRFCSSDVQPASKTGCCNSRCFTIPTVSPPEVWPIRPNGRLTRFHAWQTTRGEHACSLSQHACVGASASCAEETSVPATGLSGVVWATHLPRRRVASVANNMTEKGGKSCVRDLLTLPNQWSRLQEVSSLHRQ